jgi:hypothetical protein
MGFWEIVAATALGATVPVLLARYLDWRPKRRTSSEFARTGLGRYMETVMDELDKNAGRTADEMRESR